MSCFARNAAGTVRTCTSTAATYVNLVQAITSNSYIYFIVNDAGQCSYLNLLQASYLQTRAIP